MHEDQTTTARVLAVSLSSRGFGYAVMERNNRLVDYGHKVLYENRNVRCLAHIEKLMKRNAPDALVLSDVDAKGVYRAPRIKELNQEILALANNRKLKVVKISARELRERLLGREIGTRHEIAELLASQFPDELASRLPTKRRDWESEDARMDIFEAVELAIASKIDQGK